MNKMMSREELLKRYLLFIAGLFFAGVGVAFTKHGGLGVSPISSVANVLSLRFPVLSIGNWLIVWNCMLIVAQIVILRKDFKIYQFLQIPLSFLFGWFTDIGMYFVSYIPPVNYAIRLILLITGILVLAFGVSLSVIANVILNSGEAVVMAISEKSHKEFGNVKVAFDIACVMSAIILSMIFFNMKIYGTREGTIISALLTGFAVKFFTKILRKPLERRLAKQT